MKKTYMIPTVRVMELHQSEIICTSTISRTFGNSTMKYGGGSTTSARVREYGDYDIWSESGDDDWSD